MAADSLRTLIEKAVSADRFFVSQHARQRLRQRGILLWQVVSSLPDGTLLAEQLHDRPHPAIDVRQTLPDGTDIKAIWSYDTIEEEARLVTVHYFDR